MASHTGEFHLEQGGAIYHLQFAGDFKNFFPLCNYTLVFMQFVNYIVFIGIY